MIFWKFIRILGNNVEIEHNCTLTSCLIDDNVTVGFKSIVSEGAVLERGCVIGSNSYVPPARLIPRYYFVINSN